MVVAKQKLVTNSPSDAESGGWDIIEYSVYPLYQGNGEPRQIPEKATRHRGRNPVDQIRLEPVAKDKTQLPTQKQHFLVDSLWSQLLVRLVFCNRTYDSIDYYFLCPHCDVPPTIDRACHVCCSTEWCVIRAPQEQRGQITSEDTRILDTRFLSPLATTITTATTTLVVETFDYFRWENRSRCPTRITR